MTTTARKGKQPASPFKKAAKELIAAFELKSQAEQTFNLELNVSDAANPTREDQEKIEIAEKRVELNRELSPLLKVLFHMARDKTLDAQGKAKLAEMQGRRDEIYAELSEMPQLGMTQKDWMRVGQNERKKGLGRPGVSTERNYIEKTDAYNQARKIFDQEFEALSGKELHEVQSMFGKGPIKTETLFERKDEYIQKGAAGRPSGGDITKLERQIKSLDKQIAFITSGEAEKDQNEKIAAQKISSGGKRMGRPFEDLDEKLSRLQGQKQGILNKIAEIERSMSPRELVERKLVIARRALKAKVSEMDSMGLSEAEDRDHPVVEDVARFKLVIAGLMDKRKTVAEEAPAQTSKPSVSVATETMSKVAQTETKAEIDKEKIKAKAKIMAKAKIIAAKKRRQKELEAAQKSNEKPESDALRSILG